MVALSSSGGKETTYWSTRDPAETRDAVEASVASVNATRARRCAIATDVRRRARPYTARARDAFVGRGERLRRSEVRGDHGGYKAFYNKTAFSSYYFTGGTQYRPDTFTYRPTTH